MVKFFRQHQKWILLMMCVLMVVFTVQFAKNPFGGGGDTRPYAQFVLQGKQAKLTYQEVLDAHADLMLLETLSAESPRAMLTGDQRGPLFRSLSPYIYGNPDKETGGAAWALWIRLAEDTSIVATDAERKAFYSQYQLTDAIVNKVRDKSNTTIVAIEKAINHWLAVRKMTDLAVTQTSRLPSYVIERIARNLTESAQVNVVRPDLDLFTRLASTNVGPDELRAQFKKYSDKFRGLKGSPVGYRVPDQISVEVLGVDILAMISDDQAKDFYRKNPDRYMETAPTSQPSSSSATSQPTGHATSQPTSKPTSQPAATKRPRPLDAELIRQIKMTLATSQPEKAISATQPAKAPVERAYDALLKAAEAISKNTSYNPATDQSYLLAEAQIAQDLHVKPFEVSVTKPFSAVELQERLDDPAPESPAGPFGSTPRDIALLMDQGKPISPGLVVAPGPAPAALAFQSAQPLVGDPKGRQVLLIGQQLTVVFTQGQGRLFIWRLTAARPNYVPDLDQVEALVRSDVIRVRAAEDAERRLRAIATAVAAPNGPTLDKAVESANADLTRQRAALAALPAAPAAATQPGAKPTTGPDKPTSAPDGKLKFLTVVNRVELYRQRLFRRQIDEEGIARRVGDNQAAFIELYKEALSQSWDLLPGDPPADLPSQQVIKAAFDLAGKHNRREAKPDKLIGVVNDPDTGVCALLQLVDVVEAGEKKFSDEQSQIDNLFQLRQESQFKQNWFNIFRRLDYRGPKKGQGQQQQQQEE